MSTSSLNSEDPFSPKRFDRDRECFFQRAIDRVDEILTVVLAEVGSVRVPVQRRPEALALIASRRAELARLGVGCYEQLRRERGDLSGIPFQDWEERAKIVMLAAARELFAELGLDDDEDGDAFGRAGSGPGAPPSRPTGGMALRSLGEHGELRMPVAPHPDYLGDRDAVARYALRVARGTLRRLYGSFSGSDTAEEIAMAAAERAIAGYERSYDPSRGTLRAYISTCVLRAVTHEYQRWCRDRRHNLEAQTVAQADLLQEIRLRSGSTEQDPLMVSDSLAEERADRSYRELLEIAMAQLGESHRAAIERKLRGESATDERERMVRKRAMANLRRIVASIDRPAA